MAHPYAAQAKASQQRRLGALKAKPGKAWGSSQMYKKTSYPTKNAGTQRELTISGKSSPKRADRKGQVGNFADGGAVGKFAFGGDTGGKKKRERKPAHTTNIIISHAGGRGGGGGGAGRSAPPAPVPVPVNRPVPVPVAAGPRPPLPPVGAAGPGPVPAGPPPVPVRPPVPPAAVGPRPPGMAAGGAVKKAANGGFLKDSPGKTYEGYPHSPTKGNGGDKVSPHKDGGTVGKRAEGGAVKKRAIGGGFGGMGGLAGPFAGSNQPGDPTPQAAGGLFQGPGPQRGPTPPIQGPPTLSGRPARPAMPLTVPMGASLAGRLTRPAPGLTVGYSEKGGTVGRKKGGAVHDDEAEDRKLFGKMIKEKGLKRAKGGVVNPGSNKPPPDLPGSIYHQQGVGMRNKGGSVGTKESTAGMSQKLPSGAAGGLARLSKTKAAKSVPAKTEA